MNSRITNVTNTPSRKLKPPAVTSVKGPASKDDIGQFCQVCFGNSGIKPVFLSLFAGYQNDNKLSKPSDSGLLPKSYLGHDYHD